MDMDGTPKKKARTAAPLKIVEARAKYKMIPVDEETFARFLAVCEARSRKQGAQVKVWVDAEYRKLPKEAVGETT